MVGQRLGHKLGHYFVVMTVEIDSHAGFKSTETQTDTGHSTDTNNEPEVAAWGISAGGQGRLCVSRARR